MTGRRILDAAAIFKAARGVASKHVAFRANQLDLYSKTSTVAKAVQSQTDRITLTVKGASALADRFNRPASQYPHQASKPSPVLKDSSIQEERNAGKEFRQVAEGLAQEQSNGKLGENIVAKPTTNDDLYVKHEKAGGQPISDKTYPLDSQGSDRHVIDHRIDQDEFDASTSKNQEHAIPEGQAIPEQDQLSEEAYSELFHSPKIARLLKGQPKNNALSKDLDVPGGTNTPFEKSKSADESDQVSSRLRIPGPGDSGAVTSAADDVDTTAPGACGKEDVHALAADIAEDAEKMPSDNSEVSPESGWGQSNSQIAKFRLLGHNRSRRSTSQSQARNA